MWLCWLVFVCFSCNLQGSICDMLTEEFFILVRCQVTVTNISNVSTWVSSFLSYTQGKYNKEVMIMTPLQFPIFILVRCQVTVTNICNVSTWVSYFLSYYQGTLLMSILMWVFNISSHLVWILLLKILNLFKCKLKYLVIMYDVTYCYTKPSFIFTQTQPVVCTCITDAKIHHFLELISSYFLPSSSHKCLMGQWISVTVIEAFT